VNKHEEQLFWMKVANLYMEQANEALATAKRLKDETRREETAKDVKWLNEKRKVIRIDAS
jgi:hypothetical protein